MVIAMRIVGGKYRSRNIEFPTNQEITRPTKDAVREGVFNALTFDIDNAIILDLFAGSGSMGLESLSRGANMAYFVDKDKEAIRIIRKNIQMLNESDKSVVLNCDYLEALNSFIEQKVKFDIVFLDPPYKLNVIDEIINTLIVEQILNEHGIIVIETDYPIELDDDRFIKNKNYKYGRTLVTIRRK